MRIGTTPTHVFSIPFDTLAIRDLRVSYVQGNSEIVTKKKSDCVLDGASITVKLSQEDTLRFHASKMVEIQIKILMNDGEALTSDIMTARPDKCLNKEVLR